MSEYLHGVHVGEPGAGQIYPEWDGARPGWRLWVKAVGHDPADSSGDDFQLWKEAGFGVIVRLQHGWNGGGCIPSPDLYGAFAQRCANYVSASRGIDVVIIGNEPNHSQEWPVVDGEPQPIDAADYVDCFDLCYEAIRWTGSPVQVCLAAIAPYNAEMGDWLVYHADVLDSVVEYDAVAIHAYSRGQDPAAITDPSWMEPPYDHHYSGFLVYTEWMLLVPDGIPTYLTEFNPLQEPRGWQNRNTGIIREMYCEIDAWNQAHPRKPFICALPYRTAFDDWAMHDKPSVIQDYQQATEIGYPSPRIAEEEPIMPETQIPIQNGGFEDGFREWHDIPQLKVANGWEPWWHDNDTRPEYKIAIPDIDPRRIRTGEGAQQWFNTYATHTAGILQRIEGITPGAALRFESWVQAFSRSDDADFGQSNGRYRMRVGIDPYGGLDPEGPDVVWSEAVQPYDQYQRIEVACEAKSDRCTLFVWGQPEWAVKHNNAYVDDCALWATSAAPEPEPEPEPEPPGDGWTEAQIRAIAEVTVVEALRAGADYLESI